MNENTIKLFSSKNTDNWQTPPDIIKSLKDEFGDLYDPCPLQPKKNGLKVSWRPVTFVNPPYSRVKAWLEKAHKELITGNAGTVIFLTYANTDTGWFHDLILPYAEIRFIRGRLKFLDASGKSINSAMRPSMLAIFYRQAFLEARALRGDQYFK